MHNLDLPGIAVLIGYEMPIYITGLVNQYIIQ